MTYWSISLQKLFHLFSTSSSLKNPHCLFAHSIKPWHYSLVNKIFFSLFLPLANFFSFYLCINISPRSVLHELFLSPFFTFALSSWVLGILPHSKSTVTCVLLILWPTLILSVRGRCTCGHTFLWNYSLPLAQRPPDCPASPLCVSFLSLTSK